MVVPISAARSTYSVTNVTHGLAYAILAARKSSSVPPNSVARQRGALKPALAMRGSSKVRNILHT